MILLLTLLMAYLLGSVPFGLVFSNLFKLPDPRTVGSQNIGATNVLRSGNKAAAGLTFLCDALKGSAAVACTLIIAPDLVSLAGLFAVIGHIWSPWLGFRGGKGVATAFGVLIMLSWPVTLASAITWVAMAKATRYSSLAALISILLSPLYSLIFDRHDLLFMCLGLSVLIVITHRQNISRLMTGRETKIGHNSTPPSGG